MNDARDPQSMKPLTAAQKLGVYLPATPEDFQTKPLTRSDVDELQANPPEWLVQLRANGPHPRSVIAGKLGVSIAGLARGEATDALTTAEIQALLQAPPAWLVQERATQAEVRFEKERVRERDAQRRAKAEVEAHDARQGGGGGR